MSTLAIDCLSAVQIVRSREDLASRWLPVLCFGDRAGWGIRIEMREDEDGIYWADGPDRPLPYGLPDDP